MRRAILLTAAVILVVGVTAGTVALLERDGRSPMERFEDEGPSSSQEPREEVGTEDQRHDRCDAPDLSDEEGRLSDCPPRPASGRGDISK